MMSDAYYFHLQELVEMNEVPEKYIDQSVRRILALKQDLGLFKHVDNHFFASSWKTENQKQMNYS